MKRFMIFLTGFISGYYLHRLFFYSPIEKIEEEPTAYVTKAGSKYHRAGCRHLQKVQIPMGLKDAMRRYGPCSVCRPPAH